MAGKDAVVLAEVEGVGVVVAVLVSEVVFCRFAFSLPSRDLVDTALTAVRAVLPHGNSTGDVRKEESHCGIKSHSHDI